MQCECNSTGSLVFFLIAVIKSYAVLAYEATDVDSAIKYIDKIL